MDDIFQILLIFLAISVGTGLVVVCWLSNMPDPREPPLVPASIPYIGHVVGLMRSKFNYYVHLRYFLVPFCTLTRRPE